MTKYTKEEIVGALKDIEDRLASLTYLVEKALTESGFAETTATDEQMPEEFLKIKGRVKRVC